MQLECPPENGVPRGSGRARSWIGPSRRAFAAVGLAAYLLGLSLVVGPVALVAAGVVGALATVALVAPLLGGGRLAGVLPTRKSIGLPRTWPSIRVPRRSPHTVSPAIRAAATRLAAAGGRWKTTAEPHARRAAAAVGAAVSAGRRRAAEVADELPRLVPAAPAAPKAVAGLRADWRLRQAQALNRRGAAARRDGRWRDAAAAHRQALEIYREAGDRKREGLSLANLALAEARLDGEAAVATCEEAAAILREVGERTAEGQVLTNLGALHHRAGRDDAAHRCWAQALALLDPASPEHARVAERLTLAS